MRNSHYCSVAETHCQKIVVDMNEVFVVSFKKFWMSKMNFNKGRIALRCFASISMSSWLKWNTSKHLGMYILYFGRNAILICKYIQNQVQFSAILDSLVIVSDKTCKILGKFFARSFKIMHYSCRKLQDSWKKYQFLARVLKEISGLMKFLQDMSGSWNISTFL